VKQIASRAFRRQILTWLLVEDHGEDAECY
jgi:hypothetical protein